MSECVCVLAMCMVIRVCVHLSALLCCYCWHRYVIPPRWLAVTCPCTWFPACGPQFRLGCIHDTTIRRNSYGASYRLPHECGVCPAGPCPGVVVETSSFNVVIWRVIYTVSDVANEIVVLVSVPPSPPSLGDVFCTGCSKSTRERPRYNPPGS